MKTIIDHHTIITQCFESIFFSSGKFFVHIFFFTFSGFCPEKLPRVNDNSGMYWKYHCSCCYCFRFLIYCLFFRCSSSQKQWPSLLFLVISRFNVWKGNQRQIVEVELICSLNSYSNTHFLIVSRSSTLFLQFFKNFLSFSLSPSSFTRSILRSLFVFHFPILPFPRHFHPSPSVPSHRSRKTLPSCNDNSGMYWKYHCLCCYCFHFLMYCLFF